MNFKAKTGSTGITQGHVYVGNLVINSDGDLAIAIYNDGGQWYCYSPSHFTPHFS